MTLQERSEQADGRREQKTETIQYPGGGGNDGKKKRKAETKQRKTLVDQRASVGGKKKSKKKSVLPILLDSEAPFPRQVVIFVVVGELGLDMVGAAGQHPFWSFLHCGEELVLLAWSGAVAAHHVIRLVNCASERERKRRTLGSRGRLILVFYSLISFLFCFDFLFLSQFSSRVDFYHMKMFIVLVSLFF